MHAARNGNAHADPRRRMDEYACVRFLAMGSIAPGQLDCLRSWDLGDLADQRDERDKSA